MKTQTTYQTQYQPKGGKPSFGTGMSLCDLTTI
jgi:hypothetical protein